MVRSICNVMKLAFKYGAKWGYLRANPMAEKRVELPRGSTKRTKQPVQLTRAWFFLGIGPFDCAQFCAHVGFFLGPTPGKIRQNEARAYSGCAVKIRK